MYGYFSSLDPKSFSGLDVLEELDLSKNKLTDLPGNLLTELKSLKVNKSRRMPNRSRFGKKKKILKNPEKRVAQCIWEAMLINMIFDSSNMSKRSH